MHRRYHGMHLFSFRMSELNPSNKYPKLAGTSLYENRISELIDQ